MIGAPLFVDIGSGTVAQLAPLLELLGHDRPTMAPHSHGLLGSIKTSNSVLITLPWQSPLGTAWRGAAPVQATILHGDRLTGVTCFVLDEEATELGLDARRFERGGEFRPEAISGIHDSLFMLCSFSKPTANVQNQAGRARY